MVNRQGWAWGTTGAGEWLTILGSHWERPALAATAEEAVRPEAYDAPWFAGEHAPILAHVTEVWHPGVESGRAYRINRTATGAASEVATT